MSPIIKGIVASGISGHLTPPWSGPEGGYDALATITIGSTAVPTITFAGIPQGYKHLQLRGSLWTSGATNPSWLVNNDDTSSRYTGHHLWGTGSSAASNNQSGTVYFNYNPSTSYPSAFIMDWFDYTSSKNKTMRTFAGSNTNGDTASETAVWSGLYSSTDPITSITLSGTGANFNQHSQVTLYGVK